MSSCEHFIFGHIYKVKTHLGILENSTDGFAWFGVLNDKFI